MSGGKVSYNTPPARQAYRSSKLQASAGIALVEGATNAAIDVAKVVGFVTIGAAAATVRAGSNASKLSMMPESSATRFWLRVWLAVAIKL